MPDPTVSWARIGDLDPTMKDVTDHFVALGPDGQTIGIVLRVEHGSETGQWMWSMTRMHPGPPLNVPRSGMTETRGERRAISWNAGTPSGGTTGSRTRKFTEPSQE